MSSARDPFDFSEYASSRSGGDKQWPSGSAAAGPLFSPFTAPPQPAAAASSPETATPGDPFAAPAPRSTVVLAQGKPPVRWLAFAGLAAVAGIAFAVFSLGGASVLFAFVGWVLAGLLAFGLLAMFSVSDTRRRAMSAYAESRSVVNVYRVVVAVAIVGVGLGAWSIADWAGRL